MNNIQGEGKEWENEQWSTNVWKIERENIKCVRPHTQIHLNEQIFERKRIDEYRNITEKEEIMKMLQHSWVTVFFQLSYSNARSM